jgi:hypothetical protein
MRGSIGAFGVALAVVCFAGGLAPASAQSPPQESWHYTWTEPSGGAAVAYYVAEILVDGKETLRIDRIGETEISIPVEYGHDYEIRVAAVDESGRQGAFSAWSHRETCELPME